MFNGFWQKMFKGKGQKQISQKDRKVQSQLRTQQQSGFEVINSEVTKYYLMQNQYFQDVIIQKGEHEIRLLSQQQWQECIKKQSMSGISKKNLYFSILMGIPFHVRKYIWVILAGVKDLKQEYKDFKYQLQFQQKNRNQDQIMKDVRRTMTQLAYFGSNQTDKSKLANILRAYSNFDPELGYVQGMNFIVGNLLFLLDAQQRDKQLKQLYYVIDKQFQQSVFWIFVHIMTKKGWRSLFQPKTPGLYIHLNLLQAKIKQNIPQVYEHIKEKQLDMIICFSQYYFTLLLYNTPQKFGKRIIDLFLFQGEKVIHSIVIKMIQVYRAHIMKLDDICQLTNFFKKQMLQRMCQSLKQDKQFAKDFKDFHLNYYNISMLK